MIWPAQALLSFHLTRHATRLLAPYLLDPNYFKTQNGHCWLCPEVQYHSTVDEEMAIV